LGLHYRPFRNTDPPALVQIWNESLAGRGAAFMQAVAPFELHILAKNYFDPRNLIVAENDGIPVGFAHAGFGPDSTGQRLATEAGVICVVAVRPNYRRQGIGTALLHRVEALLRDGGAQTIYFGAMRPLNPFYLGVYGGSELPGVLVTDTLAEPFLLANHYTLWDQCVVFQRNLETHPGITDPRFASLKRQYKLQVLPRRIDRSWYEEALLTPFELLQFQLQDAKTRHPVARAMFWEMDLYSWRWHHSCAGIVEVEVEEGLRRQGLGKFLLSQMLIYLHEQFFTQVEVQTMVRNTAAVSLYQSLGFEKVDEGRVYQLRKDSLAG
jgi:ribosomal protein S18 acetylase RimI-like enzyme